jgi:hypothetical protein
MVVCVMRIDPEQIYSDVVTVFNRITPAESGESKDYYKGTIVQKAMWSDKVTRTANGTKISIVKSHLVQLPQGVSVRVGDYIFRGEWTQQHATASEIRDLQDKCGDNAFQVLTVQDLKHGGGFHFGNKGLMRFADCISCEG